MGRNPDQFIALVDAARILGRTSEEVISLCDEGLIRRRSTGIEVGVHRGDVREVYETNLHDMARPRDLVKNVLLLQREVRALKEAINLIGDVNGMLSSSLSEYSAQGLLELSETTRMHAQHEQWDINVILIYCEVFLRISDSDILRLNESIGVHDSWKPFYTLCLKMSTYARDAEVKDELNEKARALLQRGLRNLRSIGVLFIENQEFLNTSKELLERTMSQDLAQFDTLVKKLKSDEPGGGLDSFVQNQ